ncbi:unnamed protein product, partial [Brenthis ino]
MNGSIGKKRYTATGRGGGRWRVMWARGMGEREIRVLAALFVARVLHGTQRHCAPLAPLSNRDLIQIAATEKL